MGSRTAWAALRRGVDAGPPTERWLDDFYASTGWRNRRHYVDALSLSPERRLGDLLEPGGWDGEYPKVSPGANTSTSSPDAASTT